METITVGQLLEAVHGTLLGGSQDMELTVSGVDTDSRDIHPGSLFIPLVGERFDGHAYITSALEAGAAGCLTARVRTDYREDKFYIQVGNTERALRDLAAWYKDRFQIPFVGITGSVGKTTAKDMIAAVLSVKVLKTEGNFNNNIGLPLTLLRLDHTHQVGVLEMGMDKPGEIDYLSDIVRPEVGVITNIGDAHIENLGSREGILKAKSEIFENLKPEGLAVLNGDDALLNTLDLPFRTVRCGRSEHCAVRVMDMADHGVAGITCTVVSPRDTYHLTIPAPGEHMAYSAAIAVAVGEELGLSTEEITRGAASYEPAGSRMRVLRLRDGRLVLDDCYNANPQSMRAAVEVLAKTGSGYKIAVLGDMLELGAASEPGHRQTGKWAADAADLLVAYGPLSAAMAEAARQKGMQTIHCQAAEEVVEYLRQNVRPGDVVLAKASHAMKLDDVLKQLYAALPNA